MTDIHTLARALKNDYAALHSWRLVGEKWCLSKAMAWRIARTGYCPRSPGIRARLSLPLPEARIVAVAGPIPDGAQGLAASRCACGQWFIPNTARRKRCFMCSPFRKPR